MDDFEAVSEVVELLSGKWTVQVFFSVEKQPKTFTEIGKEIEGISNKMLSKRLNKLKGKGIIAEADSVDGYVLTEKGFELKDNLDGVSEWFRKYSGSERKILIVEDDTDQANLYTEWLKSFETEVVSVDSLFDASESDILAVIIDRYLESMETDRFIEHLRKNDVPVIICSGVEPSLKDIDMPFFNYLLKPVDSKTVKQNINELKKLGKEERRIKALKNKKKLIKKRNIGNSKKKSKKISEINDKLGNQI